jgi:hypothetical protein
VDAYVAWPGAISSWACGGGGWWLVLLWGVGTSTRISIFVGGGFRSVYWKTNEVLGSCPYVRPKKICDNVYVNINSVKIAPKHIKKEMFMKFGGVIDRHI